MTAPALTPRPGTVNIGRLRKEAPEWTWVAEQDSWGGWTYHGTRGSDRIRVYAVAMLCGPTEDDFATQWRVEDGSGSCSYTAWWMREAAKAHAPLPTAPEKG